MKKKNILEKNVYNLGIQRMRYFTVGIEPDSKFQISKLSFKFYNLNGILAYINQQYLHNKFLSKITSSAPNKHKLFKNLEQN